MGFGIDARSSRLLPTGWRTEKDLHNRRGDAGQFTGFRARCALTEHSQKVRFTGPIFLSFFMQDRFLLPLCNIDLVFSLSKPEFALRVNTAVDANYTFKIDSFKIELHRVRVTPTVATRIEERLSKSAALYPIRACNAKVS